METYEAIKNRHSVRNFSDKQISDEDLEKLIKVLMMGPSAVDIRPWEFYVIKSEEMKEKIRKAMPFGKYVSPLIIIPCIKKVLHPMFKVEFATCDLSASIENLMVMASSLGIGSVWCAIYPSKDRIEEISKVLDCPKNLTPFGAVYLGYPSDKDKGKIKDKFDPKRVHII